MWVRWIFSVACLAVAVYHLAALITPSRAARGDTSGPARAEGQRGYELSHLAMALGMAAMFSPFGDPIPPLAWSIIFGMAAAWFAACALRAGTPAAGTSTSGVAQHHLVANLAMLFMVVGGHQHGAGGEEAGGVAAEGATASSGGAGHEGHLGGVGGEWMAGPLGVVLTVGLAGYFAVHAVRSIRTLVSARIPGPQMSSAGSGPVTVVVARSATTGTRVRAASHVVMWTAMTVMFGLML
ncbi:MAG: DUF5134 domain-containing protein [Pseudonocardiaceae bacterium]